MINLMNPRWPAFGDVRLSLVVGFGVAWVSPVALLEGFFVRQHAGRGRRFCADGVRGAPADAAVPFGLFLAIGAALVLAAWSIRAAPAGVVNAGAGSADRSRWRRPTERVCLARTTR